MTEHWKTIKGYKFYEISDYGRVRNKINGNIITPAILFGRNVVRLMTYDGKCKQRTFYVDNLVAYNFLIPPYTISYHKIYHKDKNNLNDNLDNLIFRKDPKSNSSKVIIYLYKNEKCYKVKICTYRDARQYFQCTDAVLLHALAHTDIIKTKDEKEYKVEYKFNN